MPTMDALIAQYGLFAVFLGGLLEGETAFILAALAAHHGLLSPLYVFLAGTSGAIIGDQALFLLARLRPEIPFVGRVAEKPRVREALGYIERHPTIFILSFRFIYGLRTAGAVACGLSNVPSRQFMVLNAVAAAIWGAAMMALGYAFGSALQVFLGRINHIEWKIAAVAAAIGILFLAARHFGRRRRI